jgi:hypothetical protein
MLDNIKNTLTSLSELIDHYHSKFIKFILEIGVTLGNLSKSFNQIYGIN